MSSLNQENDYWTSYWTTNQIVKSEDPLCQVGRTINKIPFDRQKWQFQLHEIEKILNLSAEDTFLDLCAGNGLMAQPFSLKCKSVTAVDVSPALLEKIDTVSYPSINVIVTDVRSANLPAGAFSKGLMYGALQYFNEREVIGILETILRSLIDGGLFLIGDIPDIDRIFTFHNKPEWVKAYFDSIRTNTPAIGTWFKREVLLEMVKYVGFSNARIIDQHPDLINSHYRFDLLLKK